MFHRIHLDSIATRLALWFCLSSVLLTWTLAQLIGTTAENTLRDQISKNLSDLAMQTADKLDQGFYERYREIELLSQNSLTGGASGSLASRQAQLDRIQASYRDYAWIGVTDVDGKVLYATKGVLAGVNVNKRPWFQIAMSGQRSLGDLHEAKLLANMLPATVSGEPLRFLDIAFPYQDLDGAVAGVLGAHLSWEWARNVERSVITATARQAGIEALILGADGTVLLGNKNTQGTRVRLDLLPTATSRQMAASLRWNDRREYLVASAKARGHGAFPGFGWTVIVRQDAEVAFAPVQAVKRQVVMTGIGIAVLFSLLGIFSARRVSQSLVRLADDVNRYQQGQSLEIRVPAKAHREVQTLARSFTTLLRNLDLNEDALRAVNAELERRVGERTAALAKSEDRVRQILENSHEAFIAIGRDQKVTDWNRQAVLTFGWSAEEAIGAALSELIIPEHMRAAHDAGFENFLKTGSGPAINKRIELPGQHKDGHAIPVEMSIAAVADGDSYVANAFLRDITDRKAADDKLKASEKRLRAITDNLPVLISYIDRDQRFRFANNTFKEWLNVEPASIFGKTMREVLGEALYMQRKPMVDLALSGETSVSEMQSTALGIERHLAITYVPDKDDAGVTHGFYTLTSDVSVMRRAEQRMATLARHDSMTGLPNRYQLEEKLDEAVQRCKRSGMPLALMFLDIDHFKRINDSLGHAAGDEVLKVFAARLRSAVRVTDTVGRLAGDEFIVILEGVHTAGETELVAKKIIEAVADEMPIASQALVVSTSIGIAFTDGRHLIAAELMSRADKALYLAKASGRGRYFCDVMDLTQPPASPLAQRREETTGG